MVGIINPDSSIDGQLISLLTSLQFVITPGLYPRLCEIFFRLIVLLENISLLPPLVKASKPLTLETATSISPIYLKMVSSAALARLGQLILKT